MNFEDTLDRLEEIVDASRERLGAELSLAVLHHCQSVNALRALCITMTIANPSQTSQQTEALKKITLVIISGISANTFELAKRIAPMQTMGVLKREIDLIMNAMNLTQSQLTKGNKP